jgi:hypothetical protein
VQTHSQETRRLRELHETYAWQVNAAIGEGREDIVRELCDDFLSRALEIMAAGQSDIACQQPDCPSCAVLGATEPPPAPESPFPPQRPSPTAEAAPQRFRWLRRLFKP